MLRIRYNNSFLLLAPGSAIEMERNSPFFLVDNVTAEFSMPVTILYNEQNILLLGDIFFDYGIKTKIKLNVEVYDEASYKFRCTMVIDKSITNKSEPGKGNVLGYLLTGFSDFFNTVKDKKLVDYVLGGAEIYPFTTWDPTDSSAGFWQMVHDTFVNNNYNYVFAPIRNEAWITDETFSGWMNQLGPGVIPGGAVVPSTQIIAFTWPVPQPRLKNTLEILLAEIGWKLDTVGLNDTHWEKILVLNINPIKTTYQSGVDGLGIPIISPVASINVELNKMFSPEVTVKDFILEHCKRYGWAPVFDSESKTCYLIALKEVGIGSTSKDFTPYAGAVINTDFSAETRKFSFRNSYTGNDESITNPDFTNFSIRTPVFKKDNLPTASAEYDNSLIFTFFENAFWKVGVNPDTNTREWQLHSYNIYDEEVKNSTDEFSTNVTGVPAILTQYCTKIQYVLAVPVEVQYYGLFPYCKQPRNKQWGLRNMFWHGMVQEIKVNGTGGPGNYPYAGNTVVLPIGSVSTGWSNTFVHNYLTNEYGIISYWFKNWLRILKANTPIERLLHLPISELENLKWNDIINISNQPFLLQSYVEPIPYKGFIKANLHPLVLNDLELVSSSSTELIYLSIAYENITSPTPIPYLTFWDDYEIGDVVVRAFSDPAGTIPYNANGLVVNVYSQVNFVGVGITNQPSETFTLTGSVTNLKSWFRQGTTPGTTDHYISTYFLVSSQTYIIL